MVLTLGPKALSGEGLSPEVRTAVKEAFVLHVWSLREFFYGTRRGGLGVIAADYFARAAEWESVRPPISDSLGRDWHRVVGAVKPVSRFDPAQTDCRGRWPVHRFLDDLVSLAEVFVKRLPPARADWFRMP
jgi:hypothetical protein